jgi:catechol 2,3-dioxygenase-like lactoylglutathione lyase family enzyme
MVMFTGISPVFAVRDLSAALAHYRRLGFSVEEHKGDGAYGFARRDNALLHLAVVPEVDPLTNAGCAYLYVDDADLLHADWADASVDGRLVAPVDTDYGLREGAHVDPDGNLIRFGSPMGHRWPLT